MYKVQKNNLSYKRNSFNHCNVIGQDDNDYVEDDDNDDLIHITCLDQSLSEFAVLAEVDRQSMPSINC